MNILFPLGLLFSAIGALLTVFGLVSGAQIDQRSLGVNVNLWWGLAILLFGVSCLLRSRRRTAATHSREHTSES